MDPEYGDLFGFDMVLILYCTQEIGAHVRNNLCYLICLRHMILITDKFVQIHQAIGIPWYYSLIVKYRDRINHSLLLLKWPICVNLELGNAKVN